MYPARQIRVDLTPGGAKLWPGGNRLPPGQTAGKLRLMLKKTKNRNSKYWSGKVTKESNVLDLEPGVFTWKNPRRIARSLKKSAEKSTRRKGTVYQSAMSMLNFYINRAGQNLTGSQKTVLERAKRELKNFYKTK